MTGANRVRRAGGPAAPPRWAPRPAPSTPGGRRGERRSDHGGDRGSATVELAVGMPARVLMLTVGIGAVVAVRAQVECVDAAREVARTLARGEPPTRDLPPGATVAVTTDGDLVRATVTMPLGGPLGALTVSATSVAALEPGVPDATA